MFNLDWPVWPIIKGQTLATRTGLQCKPLWWLLLCENVQQESSQALLALIQNTCHYRAGIWHIAARFPLGRNTNVDSKGGCFNQKHVIQPLSSSQIQRDVNSMPRPKGSGTSCVGLNLEFNEFTNSAWSNCMMCACFHEASKLPGSVSVQFLEDKRQIKPNKGAVKAANCGRQLFQMTTYKTELQDRVNRENTLLIWLLCHRHKRLTITKEKHSSVQD